MKTKNAWLALAAAVILATALYSAYGSSAGSSDSTELRDIKYELKRIADALEILAGKRAK